MAKFKNSELYSVLSQLMLVDSKTSKMVGGLLSEEMTLGLRRRLQKIQKAFLVPYEEFQKDLEPIMKMEDGEAKDAEFKKLLEEERNVDFEPASMEMIEKIDTKANYDMALLERITN